MAPFFLPRRSLFDAVARFAFHPTVFFFCLVFIIYLSFYFLLVDLFFFALLSKSVLPHPARAARCTHGQRSAISPLLLQANNGGIVMVNFYTYFVTCNHTADLQDVIGESGAGPGLI